MKFLLFKLLLVITLRDGLSEPLTIQLHRQKTPKENIWITPNIPEHGVWLDWFKKPIRTNDTISLLKFLDNEFYGLVYVGNPGQKVRVTFDTAWSTTWIFSMDCPTKTIGCWFHEKYNHRRSSTFVKNGTSYIADEGKYNLTGYYSRDEIKFGHSKVNQTFVEMTEVPYWYIFTKADGVVGLALKDGNTNPFFYNILQQTNITNPVFSIYLNRDRSSNKGGSITIGAIDKKHIHTSMDNNRNLIYDNITYVSVIGDSDKWEFVMDGVVIDYNNKTYPVCTKDCIGLADSGTNSILTSEEYLKVINEHIGAKILYLGYYEIECEKINILPDVIFMIGGNQFKLSGKDYVQVISYGPLSLCLSSFSAGTTITELNRWILGGFFLAKYYSIYDVNQKRVGFVRAATA